MSDESAEADEIDPDEGDELWDAQQVLQARADASRADRDAAISTLRESMSDEEIRDDFGIDLGEIER